MNDNSRVWIYQSDRKLLDKEVAEIQFLGDAFVSNWAAHGSGLEAIFTIKHNAFLIFAVNQSTTAASGCSIDASVRFVKELEGKYKLDLFNRMNVAYLSNGEVEIVSGNMFRELLANNTLSEDTIVFNNLIEKWGELNSKWKTPIKSSWHKQLL